jgi:Protein of unknown function (DUF3789)
MALSIGIIAFFLGTFVGSMLGVAVISALRLGVRADEAMDGHLVPADALAVGEESSLSPSIEPENV